MKVTFHSASLLLLVFIASCTAPVEKEPANNPLLGKGFGISATTLVVKDLDSTSKYFSKVLGFKMPEKFQPGMYLGTKSAAVSFADFSALELIGVNDSGPAAKLRPAFINSYLKQFEGVRAYSLFTSSADSTRSWLNTRGFKIDTPQSGRITTELAKGWDWDDGGPQFRSLAFNTANPPAYMPGFVEVAGMPYEEIQEAWRPYAWRKYYDENPNGVINITALRIVVKDLEAARKEFKQMGLWQLSATDSSADFKVAHDHRLQLVSPRSSTSEAAKFLQSRGPGVYAIGFAVKNLSATQDFFKKTLPARALVRDTSSKRLLVLKEFTHGVQFEFMQESQQQASLAQIYSFKEGTKLDTASLAHAAALYAKYCALCHGKNREGNAADYAPSLRSHTLMATTQLPRSSYNFLSHTISYGRAGTAMAPYAKSQGGPLHSDDIELLIQWMHELSGVKKPVEMSPKPVSGNVALGGTLYAKHCASCHGGKGEGIRAPALGNPILLATASDDFLRYTITEGRDSTAMPSFKDSLSKQEINSITAYLRSRASGWNAPAAVAVKHPSPAEYIIHPKNKAPEFTLREGLYVSAVQLAKALKDSARMIMLDARSEAAWHQSHIPGAVSVPYYKEPDKFIKDIPNDSTLIVVYCACPHAASNQVVNTLKRFGYKHTAILDEGILVWTQRGYPVRNGDGIPHKK